MADNFYRKVLANGLTILFEKRSLPVVSVSSAIKYGSAFEQESRKGISHFIEHLMFKGSKTRSQQELAREIEKKGGMLNGFTAEELTCYLAKLPSRHLLSGINITSDLILNPKFDSVEFEKEKNVIIEEIKMYHDNPSYYAMDKIKELLYKKPFGSSALGKAEVIRSITLEEVKKLFSSIYTTDSMILTVVGNADFNEICSQAEKIFPKKTRKAIEYFPVKQNLSLVEKRKQLEQAHFVFGFHSPEKNNPEKYSYEIAGAYLFGGMSSKLFQEIREKRSLAYAVRGDFDSGKNYGHCLIYIGALKEKINEIKEIIIKEIKNINKIEKKDFEACQEQLIGSKKVEEEDSVNVMTSLTAEELAGNVQEYYNYEKNILKVKLEDMKKISKMKKFSSFTLLPES